MTDKPKDVFYLRFKIFYRWKYMNLNGSGDVIFNGVDHFIEA